MKLFHSIDGWFLASKVLTLLVCLPWPLTLVATLMSLSGEFPAGTPAVKVLLIRLGWGLVLVYPLVFWGLVLLAERVIAPLQYHVALAISMVPFLLSSYVCYRLFFE